MPQRVLTAVLVLAPLYIICSPAPVIPASEELHPSEEILIIAERAEQCTTATRGGGPGGGGPNQESEYRLSGDCDGNRAGC